MRQPLFVVAILKPGLIHLMLRVLDLPKFFQKKPQVSIRNANFLDVVLNRIVVLANILGDGQLPGTVVVCQTLRDQERPLREIPRKVLAEVENQILHRAAAIGSF